MIRGQNLNSMPQRMKMTIESGFQDITNVSLTSLSGFRRRDKNATAFSRILQIRPCLSRGRTAAVPATLRMLEEDWDAWKLSARHRKVRNWRPLVAHFGKPALVNGKINGTMGKTATARGKPPNFCNTIDDRALPPRRTYFRLSGCVQRRTTVQIPVLFH